MNPFEDLALGSTSVAPLVWFRSIEDIPWLIYFDMETSEGSTGLVGLCDMQSTMLKEDKNKHSFFEHLLSCIEGG